MIHLIAVVIGIMLVFMGVLMGVPAIVDLSGGFQDWIVFAVSSALSVFVGLMCLLTFGGQKFTVNLRGAYLLTTTSWLAVSIVAALPFWFSETGISFTDSVFEAISGLTTTGSTVLTGLDRLPPGLLLWRGILQWIGGIGIIVMAVLALPFLHVGGMQLYQLESSDFSDKATARITETVMQIFAIYILLTGLSGSLYMIFGMTVFEAAVHAMTTVSTGGYSTTDQSMAGFSGNAIKWVAVVFMIAGSLPFNTYVKALRRKNPKTLLGDSQIRVFFLIALGVVALLAFNFWSLDRALTADTFTGIVFSVVSVMTTTGYAVDNYLVWGSFAVAVFFFLTFVGGCAGSTAGGIKIFRFEIMTKEIRRQLQLLIHPHRVITNTLNGQRLRRSVTASVGMYFILFFLTVMVITVINALLGLDFATSFSAALTTVSNVGPGLGNIIGPSGNFASLPDASKWLLDFAMLAGRLEFMTVYVLLAPVFWQDLVWQ